MTGRHRAKCSATASWHLLAAAVFASALAVGACDVAAPGIGVVPVPAAVPSRPQVPHASAFAERIGINTHFYMGAAEGDPLEQMRTLKAAGVTMVREPIKWDQVQPVEGLWKWQIPDALMAASAKTGVDVLAVAGYSAPWASSDPRHRDTMYPPSKVGAFATFTAAIAARYGAGGQFWRAHPELTPRPLAAIEIWNEPWSYTYWKPVPDPAAYLALARPAARAVRRVAPTVKLLVSGDLLEARADARFVEWIDTMMRLDPGIGSWADVLSVHPYPNPGARGPLDGTLDARLRFSRLGTIHERELARHVSLPIWVTEIGWATGTNRHEQVDDSTQAQYIGEAVTHALGQFGPFVQRVFVFSWDVASTAPDQAYGLRRANGTTKPAWTTLTKLLRG